MGHHLPGMIRAYGDRNLFTRFRTRFLVAPILLLTVSIWSSWYEIQAIQLLAFGWGIWHGMMQTYGFCRIYDGKASASAAARARADFWLCASWFVAAVLLSPMRFRTLLDLYYESGGPVVPAVAVSVMRLAIMSLLAAVTLFFAWQQWTHWRSKGWGSPIKITLLVSSIAFWWYCNNGVQNILVGIALFEVFHDVQYLSIVWIYNRSRVERDNSVKGFMRFIFRKSGALIGVYVGLVLAYGSIAFTASGSSALWVRHALIGVVTASALLHFYYDGFIWKVRETQTRSNLGIGTAGIASAQGRFAWPTWVLHSLRWSALIIPFGLLCSVQLLGRVVPPLERTAKVVEVLPGNAQAQLNFAEELHKAGQLDEAIKHYNASLERDGSSARAEYLLGLAYSDQHQYDLALKHYEKSISLDPKNATTEFRLALLLKAFGRPTEARVRLEHVVELDPKMLPAQVSLGDVLSEEGNYDAAAAHYREALHLKPDLDAAERGLAYAESYRRR